MSLRSGVLYNLAPLTDYDVFPPATCCYPVRLHDGFEVQVFFKHALDALIPVGEQLYLRQSGERPLLAVRLNVPCEPQPEPGKVHVTYVEQAVVANRSIEGTLARTVLVDPWHLVLEENLRGQPTVPALSCA